MVNHGSLLGPFWVPHHRRPRDYEFLKALQPSVCKIQDGGDIDYRWARENLPNALIIARSWAMGEQHAEIAADPVGTGKRHAQMWSDRRTKPWHEVGDNSDAPLRNPLGFDPENTIVLGCNEIHIWESVQMVVLYTIAFLDECTRLGLRAGALQLSVGWPGNHDDATHKDTPPDWSGLVGVEAAIKRNRGVLVTHSYWAKEGPARGWGWWGGRVLKCPWQVPIVIGECGMEEMVDHVVDDDHRGWRAYISSDQYADQLIEYCKRISVDKRIIGTCVFSLDFANHSWWTVDLEPAYDNILKKKQFIPQVSSDQVPAGTPVNPPPVVPPVVVPPVTPPVTPPPVTPPAKPELVGKLISAAPNDGTSYVFGQAPAGATIYFAWRGNDAIDGIKTGPHSGYEGWKPGYFNIPLYVRGKTPAVGKWDVWAKVGAQNSPRVQFDTDGVGGKSNQIEVTFTMTAAPVVVVPPPVVKPPVVIPPPPVVVPPVTPPVTGAAWQWPLKSVAFTWLWGVPSNVSFQRRTNGISAETYGAHEGLDFRAAVGTNVYAVADGQVAWVDTDPNYGNYIRIRHGAAGQHWDSFYAHLRDLPTFRTGDMVTKGQKIGVSGKSGTQAAHLHFEVRLVKSDGSWDSDAPGSIHNGSVDPIAFFEGMERVSIPSGGSTISLPLVMKS